MSPIVYSGKKKKSIPVYSIYQTTVRDGGADDHYRNENMVMGGILSYDRESISKYLRNKINELETQLYGLQDSGELYGLHVQNLSTRDTTCFYIYYEEINPKTKLAIHVTEVYRVVDNRIYAKGEL